MNAAVAGFKRARRLAGIELSEIVQITERSGRLRAEGKDILALSTGEPDFPTPPHVVEAAHQAALAGKTKYPPTAGIPDLRATVGKSAGASALEVIISTGAKQVIADAMLATLDPGDEVILAAPYWSSSPTSCRCQAVCPSSSPARWNRGSRLRPRNLRQP